jgi:hypothetical protein
MTATPPNIARQLHAAANGAPAVPGSLLAKLQDAAGRQQEQRTLELDVPGAFRGMMRVRYHGLPLDGLERYAEILQTGSASEFSTVLDMLVTCCDVVLGYDDDAGEWLELTDQYGPVGFDDRLARLLKLPRPDPETELAPREVVEMLFMPGGNSVPLGNHAGELATWLAESGGLDPDLSSAAAGSPSSAAPPPSE